jgi:hypothetical protein
VGRAASEGAAVEAHDDAKADGGERGPRRRQCGDDEYGGAQPAEGGRKEGRVALVSRPGMHRCEVECIWASVSACTSSWSLKLEGSEREERKRREEARMRRHEKEPRIHTSRYMPIPSSGP